MTRANARELALHLIYSRGFTGEAPQEAVDTRLGEEYYSTLAQEYRLYAEDAASQRTYIRRVVAGVAENQEALDARIAALSIGWDVKRISRVTRACLQLAMYEVLCEDTVPTNVAISEAVRLAKLYDGEDAAAFVNGILGSFARSLTIQGAE
ncbi:MAG TPA: transcription antitermination factor NusB [Candidatus Faecousia intestinigallinarum]|nr:transcription antitermination factor NusB [Candidatus Faecousia intestinigallinarum]